MFGNLFDEEGTGNGGSQTTSSELTPPPPAQRGSTKLAGIWNQGATCFLNTCLQSLSLLPELREAMFRLTAQELGFHEESRNKRRVIPIELQKLFASLMLEEQQAVSSKLVTDSFGWGNEVLQQHDVQELCSVLFPALNESLKGTSGQNLVHDLLHIKTVQKIQCEGCGNTTEKEAEESTLFVQVEGFPKGLEESLQNLFCSPEKMTGDNRYKCDVCNTHRDAQKTIKVRSLPPVLMFALNRFATDSSWRPYKVVDRFPFPMELDMGTYSEHPKSDCNQVYQLTAVIVHSGSCTGGHYTACIRDVDNLGHWEMLDEIVEDQSAQVVKADLVDCVSAKQMVATVLSNTMKKFPTVSIEKLSTEIGKQTGVPWARQYKRRHGSFPKVSPSPESRFLRSRVKKISQVVTKRPLWHQRSGLRAKMLKKKAKAKKFLKENSDIFLVEGNLVTLVERPGCNGSGDSQRSNTAVDTSNKVDNSDVGNNPAPSKSFGSKGDHAKASRKPKHVPKPGQNWFFFNDARVSPMLEEELKLEYSGKKSAYMLMYCPKNIQRPAEAEGNAAYGIPQHLLDEINKKNEELRREREEYERKERERIEEEERRKTEVQVELRYHFNYKVVNGMLTTDDHSDGNAVCQSFPLGTTLGELMDVIFLLGSGHLEEGQFHVHRMRCWDKKTHLYDELTDKSKTLQDLSIENGTILFAWDGFQVDGQPVVTGVECEPLTLQLKQFCSPHTITHTFPKNSTLMEFRSHISTLTGIAEDVLKLQFPEVVMNGEHATRGEMETLESIHLTDNACILYDGSNRLSFGVDPSGPYTLLGCLPEPEPMASDDRLCICIENRCIRESKDSPVLELEVEESMTVSSVKQLFMAMYSIQSDSAALHRLDPSGVLQAPYDEELTVKQAGITASTKLILDSTKMVIEFKLHPEPVASQQSMQVEVNKMCTVQEALLAMAQVAGVDDPHEWHVCCSNFMFDKVRVLDEWDMVLDTSSHFLLLEKGRLPPKGHVSLPIWLYRTPSQLCPTPPESMLSMDDLLINDSHKVSAAEPAFLGDVEINKDAKLDELRCRVADLLAQNQRHASASQLRLRMIEGKHNRLRRVLRDPNNTVRRLKLDNKTPVGVQIVNHGASPCKEEVLLNIRVMDRSNMTYDPPQEMIWDTRCGTSAAKLRQDIAAGLLVPEEMLIVAKHFPSEYQWKILRDVVQTSAAGRGYSKRGKKRTAGTKPNICHKPYCVEDGDIIGVIRLVQQLPVEVLGTSTVHVSADDFCTSEDLQGRRQLEEERLKKQQERRGRAYLNGISVSAPRRPEVALKIQVQDYS